MCGAHTCFADMLPEESFVTTYVCWTFVPSLFVYCDKFRDEQSSLGIWPGGFSREAGRSLLPETRNVPRVEYSLFIKLVWLLRAKSGTSLQRLIGTKDDAPGNRMPKTAEVGMRSPATPFGKVVLAAFHTTQELSSQDGPDEGIASAKHAEFVDGVLRSTEQAMDHSQPSCALDLDRHLIQELEETIMNFALSRSNLQRCSSV